MSSPVSRSFLIALTDSIFQRELNDMYHINVMLHWLFRKTRVRSPAMYLYFCAVKFHFFTCDIDKRVILISSLILCKSFFSLRCVVYVAMCLIL